MPGLLHFAIFCQIKKNTAKKGIKPGNSLGLLQFFDIFFVTVRESVTLYLKNCVNTFFFNRNIIFEKLYFKNILKCLRIFFIK